MAGMALFRDASMVQARFTPRISDLTQSMETAHAALERAFLPAVPNRRELAGLVSIAVPHRFSAKDFIIQRHRPADALWLLASGSAVAGVVDERGEWHPERAVVQGQWLDVTSAWLGEDFAHDIRAVDDVIALQFSTASFQRLTEITPSVVRLLVACLSAHARRASSDAREKLSQPVPSRLAAWLVQANRNTAGADVVIKQSKRCLASELGTSAETLSRTLRKFHDDGLIAMQAARISVKDEVGLRRLMGMRVSR